MKNEYKSAMDKIHASEEVKQETIRRMQEAGAAAPDTPPKKRLSKGKLSVLLASVACIVCLCIVLPLVLHNDAAPDPGINVGDPQQNDIIGLNERYTDADGNTLGFSGIAVQNGITVHDTVYDGYYLVLSGAIDFDTYALFTAESSLTFFDLDTGQTTLLPLHTTLTEALSEADLHVDDYTANGPSSGAIRLVFTIDAASADYIRLHAEDIIPEGTLEGDFTLQLSGCYADSSTLTSFIFFCNEITFD